MHEMVVESPFYSHEEKFWMFSEGAKIVALLICTKPRLFFSFRGFFRIIAL